MVIRGGDAVFSPDNHYRYLLSRWWSFGDRRCTFIGLMPGTTGDRLNDDRVISQCGALARSWGMDGFELVNLFARCLPSWEDLERVEDPVGTSPVQRYENDACIWGSCNRTDFTVCAWGSKGALRDRASEALEVVRLARKTAFCVAQSDGHPWPVTFCDPDTEPRRYAAS